MVATQVLKNDNSANPGRKATSRSKSFTTRGRCRHDCISFIFVFFYIMAYLPKVLDSLKIIDVV